MSGMAVVLGRHRFRAVPGACSCDQMFYDTRRTREEVLIEHDLHVEMELHEAGFGDISKVRKLAEEMAALCPPDDWPENGAMADAAIADFGRSLLAALDGTEEKE